MCVVAVAGCSQGLRVRCAWQGEIEESRANLVPGPFLPSWVVTMVD